MYVRIVLHTFFEEDGSCIDPRSVEIFKLKGGFVLSYSNNSFKMTFSAKGTLLMAKPRICGIGNNIRV